ncbi:hypothetical protein SEA_FORZA_116 [Gordonia phage Forza]|uniref:Uncharacterized protein n=1 Tax=Gordonia phage Forza TaxID=2571247 RepID=A0A650EZ49_9CAUD|nr:hypothetical protein PP303_gp116 [Gordonia phage Forza]QEM41583.1 hypothetical protein SEA_BOOPY_116 [Gordonia phage Boopy]QGT55109.1 hypothetical protein SEA_FORZA_116 [Gordonia phage Forza]UXE04257.1 hypothetical protein SEA_BLUENGOLD_115 [Gordonia phage BlueNGold]WBF03897.1 hypothetical protein SEA_MAREELIH_114 [Gordonia phage Mareelih]
MTQNTNKRIIKATTEQIHYAYDLAVARKEKKDVIVRETLSRQDVIDTLSGDGDFDVTVIDEKGRTVFDATESVTKGNVDWVLLAEEHPEINLDHYRKPATTAITIRTGGMIDAIAEEFLASRDEADATEEPEAHSV